VTSISSRQQSPPSGRSIPPAAALEQIAARICTRYPIAKAYFAQALGHRLHFLAGAGEETYLPAVKIHIKDDLYLFCEPSRELNSEAYAQLIREVKSALELS
jgi:hypothetical protein